jgi:hypothetical protein
VPADLRDGKTVQRRVELVAHATHGQRYGRQRTLVDEPLGFPAGWVLRAHVGDR